MAKYQGMQKFVGLSGLVWQISSIQLLSPFYVLQVGYQNIKDVSWQNIRACKNLSGYQVWFGRYRHYSYFLRFTFYRLGTKTKKIHHGKILGHAKHCLVIFFGLVDIVIIATIGVLRFTGQSPKQKSQTVPKYLGMQKVLVLSGLVWQISPYLS